VTKNSSKILAFPVRFRLQHADTDTLFARQLRMATPRFFSGEPAAGDFEININR
jgi:hypothetical protein